MTPEGIAYRITRRTKCGCARSLFGARARKNAGTPIVSVDSRVRWRGRNGYSTWKQTTRTASSTEYTVFVRNRVATRVMLPITRRPSATTDGRVAKLLFSSTIWATARVASEPEPMETPMSASFSARTSLTPSPVIATVCPRDWSAATISRFCCGVTRPNTAFCSMADAISSVSWGIRRASRGWSAPSIPSFAATAPTETALSPEITFVATRCSPKYARVRPASGRSRCSSTTSAAGSAPRPRPARPARPAPGPAAAPGGPVR